jgi:hypothetical protein
MPPALFLSCISDRIDLVVAFLEAMLRQDLLELQRIGGVGRIHHEGAPAQIGKAIDVALHEELVHAAVAARHDHDVLMGDLDHGERIVDRRMRHVGLAGSEPFALRPRALGELKLDLEAAPLEDAGGDAGVQRQRLGVGEGVDPQRHEIGRAGRAGERDRRCSQE